MTNQLLRIITRARTPLQEDAPDRSHTRYAPFEYRHYKNHSRQSLLDMQPAYHEAESPHHQRLGQTFSCQHITEFTDHPGLVLSFTSSWILWGLLLRTERINYISKHPDHTLMTTANSCSLG